MHGGDHRRRVRLVAAVAGLDRLRALEHVVREVRRDHRAEPLLGRADLRLEPDGLLDPARSRGLLGTWLRLGRWRGLLFALVLAERLLEPLVLGLPEEGRKRPLAHARPLTAFHREPPPLAAGSWKQPCRQGRT